MTSRNDPNQPSRLTARINDVVVLYPNRRGGPVESFTIHVALDAPLDDDARYLPDYCHRLVERLRGSRVTIEFADDATDIVRALAAWSREANTGYLGDESPIPNRDALASGYGDATLDALIRRAAAWADDNPPTPEPSPTTTDKPHLPTAATDPARADDPGRSHAERLDSPYLDTSSHVGPSDWPILDVHRPAPTDESSTGPVPPPQPDVPSLDRSDPGQHGVPPRPPANPPERGRYISLGDGRIWPIAPVEEDVHDRHSP
jgi:hypothetical protein